MRDRINAENLKRRWSGRFIVRILQPDLRELHFGVPLEEVIQNAQNRFDPIVTEEAEMLDLPNKLIADVQRHVRREIAKELTELWGVTPSVREERHERHRRAREQRWKRRY